MPPSLPRASRKPVRISVTIPRDVYEELVERSRCEGRSISNLAALLMAQALQGDKDEP